MPSIVRLYLISLAKFKHCPNHTFRPFFIYSWKNLVLQYRDHRLRWFLHSACNMIEMLGKPISNCLFTSYK